MRRISLVLLLLLGAGSPPTGGTVTGKVLMLQGGDPVTTPYAYVYLVPAHRSRGKPAKGHTYEIRQTGEQFDPHVVVVPKGSMVSFPNLDNETHNVFSPTEPHFDLGRANKDMATQVHQFDDAGQFDIYCDIHMKMWAKVKVVDSAYIEPVKDGQYAFKDVAPGTYKVVAWAPDSTEVLSRAITVVDGTTVTPSELRLQVGAIQTTHKRKDDTSYGVYKP